MSRLSESRWEGRLVVHGLGMLLLLFPGAMRSGLGQQTTIEHTYRRLVRPLGFRSRRPIGPDSLWGSLQLEMHADSLETAIHTAYPDLPRPNVQIHREEDVERADVEFPRTAEFDFDRNVSAQLADRIRAGLSAATGIHPEHVSVRGEWQQVRAGLYKLKSSYRDSAGRPSISRIHIALQDSLINMQLAIEDENLSDRASTITTGWVRPAMNDRPSPFRKRNCRWRLLVSTKLIERGQPEEYVAKLVCQVEFNFKDYGSFSWDDKRYNVAGFSYTYGDDTFGPRPSSPPRTYTIDVTKGRLEATWYNTFVDQ